MRAILGAVCGISATGEEFAEVEGRRGSHRQGPKLAEVAEPEAVERSHPMDWLRSWGLLSDSARTTTPRETSSTRLRVTPVVTDCADGMPGVPRAIFTAAARHSTSWCEALLP
jgi:hypothetical protein